VVDHQLCYTASGKFKVPLTATGAPALLLKNQFSPGGFVPLMKPALAIHCNPVTKIIQPPAGPPKTYGVTNPAAHLACLPMAAQKPQPTANVLVKNQFGSANLATRQPNLFCLPSWKGLKAPPAKKPTTPPGLSHFACYPVGVTSGGFKPPAVGLSLKDEFTTKPVGATVNPTPQELCVPTEKLVGKRDYKIVGPATSLLCFAGPKTPIKPKVWDENQFGTSVVNIRASKWLCVPSTVTVARALYVADVGDAPDDGRLGIFPISGGGSYFYGAVGGLPVSVAADASYVYWVSSVDDSIDFGTTGSVNRMPLGGGPVTQLATGQDDPISIAVDGTHVYWINRGTPPYVGTGSVNEVPLGGGSVTTLVSGLTSVNSVATDGTHVYWANSGAGTINEVPVGGGSVTALATGQTSPYGLVLDGTHAYWANADTGSSNGTENRISLGGGSVTPLATGLNHPGSPALDGTHLYWTVGDGSVKKVPLGGGSVTTLTPTGVAGGPVATDGTSVYWFVTSTINPMNMDVDSVPVGGGSPTLFDGGLVAPVALVVGP
jgi:hypothetical protein